MSGLLFKIETLIFVFLAFNMDTIISNSENTFLLNIFTMPLLSQEECLDLVQLAMKNTHIVHGGSMQKYTIDVSLLFNDIIQTKIFPEMKKYINLLFDFGKNTNYYIYTAHVILYSYTGQGEKSLKLHVDDSDITLNITLEKTDLEGCDLEFIGTTEYGNTYLKQKFNRHRNSILNSPTKVSLNTGECLFHRGNHPHQTTQITRGSRKALIIWLKKS